MNTIPLGNSPEHCSTCRRKPYATHTTAEEEGEGTRSSQQVCMGRRNTAFRTLTLTDLSAWLINRYIWEVLLTKTNLIWVTKECNMGIWGWGSTAVCTEHLVFITLNLFLHNTNLPSMGKHFILVTLSWRNGLICCLMRQRTFKEFCMRHGWREGTGGWFQLWKLEPGNT